MSNADFQDRLQRIGAKSAPQQPMDPGTDRPRRRNTTKPRPGRIGLGGAIMVLGLHGLKYANEYYEALRDSDAIGTLAGLGLGGLAALLIGVIIILREIARMVRVSSDPTGSQYQADEAHPVRQASNRMRVLFSLLGFAFGAIACLYMFMVSAARHFDTETAQLFQQGGVFIVFCLTALSLLLDLVGIFLRGFALGRVPAYFLFGGVLTYFAVPIFGIDMLEWQAFVVLLQ